MVAGIQFEHSPSPSLPGEVAERAKPECECFGGYADSSKFRTGSRLSSPARMRMVRGEKMLTP